MSTITAFARVAERVTEEEGVARLIELFNQGVGQRHGTRLVRGGEEPVYLPADARYSHHRIVFAHGYFASALHELAHWCIAGAARRQQVDYGYWYCPDGRTPAQQREFERVEARPQALEWIFSRAADQPFRISIDNLAGHPTDPAPFRTAVCREVRRWCEEGLGERARLLHRDLVHCFGGDDRLDPALFSEADLLPAWATAEVGAEEVES